MMDVLIKDMRLYDLHIRVKKVIASAKTFDQVESAARYVKLFGAHCARQSSPRTHFWSYDPRIHSDNPCINIFLNECSHLLTDKRNEIRFGFVLGAKNYVKKKHNLT